MKYHHINTNTITNIERYKYTKIHETSIVSDKFYLTNAKLPIIICFETAVKTETSRRRIIMEQKKIVTYNFKDKIQIVEIKEQRTDYPAFGLDCRGCNMWSFRYLAQ